MQECPGNDRLLALISGSLSSESFDVLAAHYLQCARCREFVRDFEADPEKAVSWLLDAEFGSSAVGFEHEPELQVALARSRVAKLSGRIWPEPHPEESVGSLKRIGDYRLLELVAQGGMGTVYKAVHTQLDKTVVVKVLPEHRLRHEEARLRFDREMKAIGRFEHPNIVRALDAGKLEKTHFIVMEFVDGIDLSRLVDNVEQLSVAVACELVRQTAVGLQHIHEHRLVHRDIKPSNLMVSRTGVVKILDLGIARLESQMTPLDDDTVSGHLEATLSDITKTGQFLGTSDYMAPEQWENTHRVDIRSDLYSLGCTLYHLLLGQAPHDEPQIDTPYKKMHAHRDRVPVDILDRRRDVPRQVAQIVRRLIAKEPDKRFQTPSLVAAAVAPFASAADIVPIVSGILGGSSQDAESADQPAVAARIAANAVMDRPSVRVSNFLKWRWMAAALMLGAVLVAVYLGAPRTTWLTRANGSQTRTVTSWWNLNRVTVTRWDPQGRPQDELFLIDGARQGNYTAWFPDGQVQQSGRYVKDRKHGPWTRFRNGGTRWYTVTFSQGTPSGRPLVWDVRGQRILEGDRKKGREWNGLFFDWYLTGQLKEIRQLRNGDRSGRTKTWYVTGERWQERDYLDGRPIGKLRAWDQNGESLTAGEYGDAKRWKGRFREWYDNGQIARELTYRDGALHGKEVRWFPEGKRWREYQWHAGALHGKALGWDRAGRLVADLEWRNGKPWDGVRCLWHTKTAQKSKQIVYRSGRLHGARKSWYPSGKQKGEVSYVHGKRHGYSMAWYENGHIKLRSAWKDGKREGTTVNNYQNGAKRSRFEYTAGELSRRASFWDRQGQLLGHCEYRDGKRWNGTYVARRKNGTRTYLSNYAGGVLHGKHMRWYNNGQLWLECEYVAGEKQSSVAWNDRGQLLGRGDLRYSNKWNGKFFEWDNERQMVREEQNYRDGNLNGPRIEWYSDGTVQKMRERNYLDGTLHGRWITWFANGRNELDLEYKNGKRHGTWIAWYPNGRKRQLHVYHMDTSIGKASYWDSTGALLGQCEWRFNRQWNGKHFVWYWQSSRLKEAHEFSNGKRVGKSMYWDPVDSRLIAEGNWQNGKRFDGRFIDTTEDGLSVESRYEQGVLVYGPIEIPSKLSVATLK